MDKVKGVVANRKEKKANEVKQKENEVIGNKNPHKDRRTDGDFHILPVPGNTNEPPQTGGGLNVNPEWEAHKVPGPFIPDAAMSAALGQPKTREELQARQAALNS